MTTQSTDNVSPPKNVLFITLDAWRASHASFMPGVEYSYTPNMEHFAETSAVFTEAVCHGPATPYAFPSLFTSTLPLDYGGYEELSTDRTHVAEALNRNGWKCVGTHANPWLGADYGYARGYDSYTDVGEFSLPGFDRMRRLLISKFGLDHPIYKLAQRLYRSASGPLRVISTQGEDEISRAKDALLKAQSTDACPTFIWSHLLDPHAPYTPAEHHCDAVEVPEFEGNANQLVTQAQQNPRSLSEHDQTVVRKLYAAAVRHADERVKELLDILSEDTLVVITADHGEGLFEHGQVGHEPCLFDELIHIPLLIRPPYGLSEQTLVTNQVRHIDIAPTILDYADISPPASYSGNSLRPLIENGTRSVTQQENLAVMEVSSTAELPGIVDPDALQIGVRVPSKKVIFNDGEIRRHKLETSPGEESSVQVETDWEHLHDRLEKRLNEIDFTDSNQVERDQEVKDRLRALGYFD